MGFFYLIFELRFLFRDTICDLDGASELANYGEYSGAPSEQQTYEYAKTVLSLMTQEKHPDGMSSYVRCNKDKRMMDTYTLDSVSV